MNEHLNSEMWKLLSKVDGKTAFTAKDNAAKDVHLATLGNDGGRRRAALL